MSSPDWPPNAGKWRALRAKVVLRPNHHREESAGLIVGIEPAMHRPVLDHDVSLAQGHLAFVELAITAAFHDDDKVKRWRSVHARPIRFDELGGFRHLAVLRLLV